MFYYPREKLEAWRSQRDMPLGAVPEQGGADGGAEVSIDSIICGDTYWSGVTDLNVLLQATSYTGNMEHNMFKYRSHHCHLLL